MQLALGALSPVWEFAVKTVELLMRETQNTDTVFVLVHKAD